MAVMPSMAEAQEAGLAMLRALGAKDLDEVISFTLYWHCQGFPVLTVERHVPSEAIGDKTVTAAAAAFAPLVQVEERVVVD